MSGRVARCVKGLEGMVTLEATPANDFHHMMKHGNHGYFGNAHGDRGVPQGLHTVLT